MSDKVLNLYVNQDQLVNAAIDEVVVELFNKWENNEGGQAVVLTGCSPLSGVTSTSISLGIAIATSKRRTLVIDCDVRKAIKYKKLNEEASSGLADYLLRDDVQLNDVIYETNIDNMYYMPCGEYSEYPTRILCSPKMEQVIEQVKRNFDCIIFDVPSITIVPDAQILFPNVDGIVLVTALGETRKKQIKEAKMKVASFESKYYGMIINKIPLDVYRQNVKDYDYYLVDGKGEQNLLHKNAGYRKYSKKKNRNAKGGKES